MDKDKIINELALQPFGNKGWMSASNLECGECHEIGKFAILFIQNSGLVHCFKCSYKTSLFNYLRTIKRLDLIEKTSASYTDIIKSVREESRVSQKSVNVCDLPRGFKRCYFDDYLDERGFTPEQYNLFQVGSSTDIRLRNHIVFPIYQNGKLSSWLARSRYSKQWHKENKEAFKRGESRLVLRYYNSDGTEFSEILGGLDEIDEYVDTVILVEGITDKANVDRLLDLYREKSDKKCCFTFGKNLSEDQLNLLIKKGVKNLILMYDPDALEEIEQFALLYSNKLSILCAKLKDKDPGDLNVEEIDEVLNSLYTPIEFYFNNLKKIS